MFIKVYQNVNIKKCFWLSIQLLVGAPPHPLSAVWFVSFTMVLFALQAFRLDHPRVNTNKYSKNDTLEINTLKIYLLRIIINSVWKEYRCFISICLLLLLIPVISGFFFSFLETTTNREFQYLQIKQTVN